LEKKERKCRKKGKKKKGALRANCEGSKCSSLSSGKPRRRPPDQNIHEKSNFRHILTETKEKGEIGKKGVGCRAKERHRHDKKNLEYRGDIDQRRTQWEEGLKPNRRGATP